MSTPKNKSHDPLLSYKAQAKLLRNMLSEDGVAITHGEALDRTARLHGVADWNVLSARVKSARPVLGKDLGTYTVADWQPDEEVAEDAPREMDFTISTQADGINIGNTTDEGDFRGLKLEIQDGMIRVMAYDERVGESPAILNISADGKAPIKADLHDHLISAEHLFADSSLMDMPDELLDSAEAKARTSDTPEP